MKFLLIFFLISNFASSTKMMKIPSKSKNPLHWFVYNGDIKQVENLIKQGISVTEPDRFKLTPLEWAITGLRYNGGGSFRKDYLKIMKLLIKEGGADFINPVDGELKFEWHRIKDIEVAKILIEEETNVNAKNRYGNTLLFSTALNNKAIALFLIEEKKADIHVKNNKKQTLLHKAVSNDNIKQEREGTIKLVSLLIERGLDVNAISSYGKAPLDRVESLEVAKLLIENGANVNIQNHKKETPLHKAVRRYDNLELASLLIENGANVNIKNNYGKTALHYAIKNGEKNVSLLIEKGADVNAKDYKENTPLHLARSLEVVKLLLDNGADVNARNNKGETALHSARTLEVIQLLIEKGADVNARNNKGETALHSARTLEVIQLLIEKGADVNARNNKGETALHSARTLEVIQLLIEKGADVNARNNKGETALHSARTLEVIQLLIEKGADVNMKDYKKLTPLHKIVFLYNREKNRKNKEVKFKNRKKQFKIIKLLIENGADIDIEDNKGKTALDYADFFLRWKIRFYKWKN